MKEHDLLDQSSNSDGKTISDANHELETVFFVREGFNLILFALITFYSHKKGSRRAVKLGVSYTLCFALLILLWPICKSMFATLILFTELKMVTDTFNSQLKGSHDFWNFVGGDLQMFIIYGEYFLLFQVALVMKHLQDFDP